MTRTRTGHKWTQEQHTKYRLTMQRKRDKDKPRFPRTIEVPPAHQMLVEALDARWSIMSIADKLEALASWMKYGD